MLHRSLPSAPDHLATCRATGRSGLRSTAMAPLPHRRARSCLHLASALPSAILGHSQGSTSSRYLKGSPTMTRAPNFGYQDPTADIGSSLVKAIFGDPTLAAKARTEASQQALRDAQTVEARRHGGLYLSQTGEVDRRNTASDGLPALFANMAPRPLEQGDPSQPTVPVDPGFAHFAPPADVPMQAAPAAAQPTPDQAFRAGLPALMAGLAQFKGDKFDPNSGIATLASFLGGDEMARRGLISQGHTPGKEFAITPDRADQIAATQNSADLVQAMGVARTNHEHDIQEARIRAASASNVAGINHASDIPVANIRAGSAATVAGISHGRNAPAFTAISDALPGATMSSGWRSAEHNREVGGVSDSNHLGLRPGVQGYDIPVQPGMTVQEAAARIEEKSGGKVRVIEARDERGRVGPNGKPLGGWHFALQSTRADAGGAKPVKAPPVKLINPTASKAIGTAVEDYYKQAAVTLPAAVLDEVQADAVRRFQQTGNPKQAVNEAVQARQALSRGLRDAQARLASETARANAAGARKAPDGNWYVRTGTRRDGSPAYSRVDR